LLRPQASERELNHKAKYQTSRRLTDVSPVARSDGCYGFGLSDEFAPGGAGSIDDSLDTPGRPGFQMFVMGWTTRGWSAAKQALPGKVCNDGDDEGALFLDRLPTLAEAVAIRKWLGLPKRVEYGEAELARRRQHRSSVSRVREAASP
jgi:hypothetical protein